MGNDFREDLFLGTWHIVASDFPMWTRSRRTRPRFHYGQLSPGRLSDLVTYELKGRERSIRGVDTRVPGELPAYRWRGSGVLKPLRSDWTIAEWDADYRWAVITFAKSLVTPAGTDIVSRSEQAGELLKGKAAELGLKLL